MKMSRTKWVGRALIIASAVVSIILWILHFSNNSGFNADLMMGVIALTVMVVYLFRGLVFRKQNIQRIGMYIFFGLACAILGALGIVLGLNIENHIVLPIITTVCLLPMFFITIVNSDTEWDDGDNHKPGYKDYRTRKAEEAKEDVEPDEK